MNKVCVYMSTYNGRRYIEQQIQSILQQRDVEVYLVIRDDGSKDGTFEFLYQYIVNHELKNVELVKGDNVGCEESFFSLLTYKYDADYYAFSDQDDYWMPDKLIKSVTALRDLNVPAMASTNLLICSEDLNPIKVMRSDQDIVRLQSRMDDIMFCNVHGCSMLWNRKLQDLLYDYKPCFKVTHDVWVCVVANVVGKTVLLNAPLIKYRQHGDNVCGYSENMIDRLKKGVKIYIINGEQDSSKIAQEVLRRYKKYLNDEKDYQILYDIADYKKSLGNKIKLMKSKLFKDNNVKDKIFRWMCILLGRY